MPDFLIKHQMSNVSLQHAQSCCMIRFIWNLKSKTKEESTHLTNQRLVNVRNVLNYQFTPKNNVFTMAIVFIVIIMQSFYRAITSITKEATFPYTNLSFLGQVSLSYYSNNVKLLSLSNNKGFLTEKQIILKGMRTNDNQQC